MREREMYNVGCRSCELPSRSSSRRGASGSSFSLIHIHHLSSSFVFSLWPESHRHNNATTWRKHAVRGVDGCFGRPVFSSLEFFTSGRDQGHPIFPTSFQIFLLFVLALAFVWFFTSWKAEKDRLGCQSICRNTKIKLWKTLAISDQLITTLCFFGVWIACASRCYC